MKLTASRKRLIAVWLVLFALIGVIAAVKLADRREDRADQIVAEKGGDRSRLLVPVPIEQLGAIEIARAGTVHRFERDAAGAWFYHGAHANTQGVHDHRTDPVVAERIAKALAGFARAKMEREFPFDAKRLDYGVTSPQTVVLLYLPRESQPLAQYAFGDIAPDTVSRYALRLGAANVFTMAEFHVQNLLSLVDAVNAPVAAATGIPLRPAAAPAQGTVQGSESALRALRALRESTSGK